jgi:hypothetical protein
MIQGMTLRDYFAAKVIHGALAGDSFIWSDIEEEVDAAYRIADAMIEKRGKEPDNILHSKMRDKLQRQIKELRELKEQTRS